MMNSYVKNAADESQVKDGEKREKRRRERELNDLRIVLASKEGRRFVWRLLGECHVFGSIWEPSAKIHYKSGQQDLGHFVLAEINEANDEALLQMMRESKQGELNDV